MQLDFANETFGAFYSERFSVNFKIGRSREEFENVDFLNVLAFDTGYRCFEWLTEIQSNNVEWISQKFIQFVETDQEIRVTISYKPWKWIILAKKCTIRENKKCFVFDVRCDLTAGFCALSTVVYILKVTVDNFDMQWLCFRKKIVSIIANFYPWKLHRLLLTEGSCAGMTDFLFRVIFQCFNFPNVFRQI